MSEPENLELPFRSRLDNWVMRVTSLASGLTAFTCQVVEIARCTKRRPSGRLDEAELVSRIAGGDNPFNKPSRRRTPMSGGRREVRLDPDFFNDGPWYLLTSPGLGGSGLSDMGYIYYNNWNMP